MLFVPYSSSNLANDAETKSPTLIFPFLPPLGGDDDEEEEELGVARVEGSGGLGGAGRAAASAGTDAMILSLFFFLIKG